MTIFAGDIKLVESKVMDDVPEGGGGPTSRLVVDGQSNNVFQDISEFDRAGGKVSLRKLHVSVQTDNTDTYLGSNIIVAEPPNDPNVSVTVFSTRDTFDTREEAQNRIESYLVRGPAWNGFLFERHVAGQRSIQICQRPNTATPPIGRTLCLISGEDTPDEYLQYVRVSRVESETRLFYDTTTNTDFPAMIVTCEISDALRFDFLGSNAFRTFVAGADRTVLRDTTVADAATYTGVVALKNAASIGDLSVGAMGIYTQLVPSSRTEAITLDAKPSAQRTFKLATVPRLIEVGLTPHSKRIRVGQENRSFSWVAMLRPIPAPETLVVSFRALGTWYTLTDDGLGILTGSGVGTVNYMTGSISLTLPALPDVGSSIIFSWGENAAYTNRSANLGFRAPEFAWALPNQGIKPGSVTVRWESGGTLRSATDDSAGKLTGDGVGQVNYAAGKVFLRPAYMIDAGGEFATDFTYSSLTTLNVVAPTLDAGGFGIIPLADSPFPGTITVKWITVRNVSATSGASEISSNQVVPVIPAPVVVVVPDTPPYVPPVYTTGPIVPSAPDTVGVVVVSTPTPAQQMGFEVGTLPVPLRGGFIAFTFRGMLSSNPDGVYTLAFVNTTGAPTRANSAPSVTAIGTGADAYIYITFDNTVLANSPSGSYYVKLLRPDGTLAGISPTITVPEGPTAEVPVPPPTPVASVPAVLPIPAIKTREPLDSTIVAGVTAGVFAGGMRLDGYGVFSIVVQVVVPPSFKEGQGWYYDPPERTDQQWSAAEVANGKLLNSLNGVSKFYAMYASYRFAAYPSYSS